MTLFANATPGAGDPRLFRSRLRVLPEWIDGNRHMNACYYLAAVRQPAIDAHVAWDYAEEFRARTGESNFVLRANVLYVRELLVHDPIVVTARITDVGDKKMTVLFEILNEEKGYLAALVEYILIHVQLGPPPRSKEMPADLKARLRAEMARHAAVPLPPQAERLRRGT
jgi:acyl-CoA thioester hydrolase